MSGIAGGLTGAGIVASKDDVYVQTGQYRLKGWQTVAITRSIETMPNSFAVTASAEFLQSAAALAGTTPGQPCSIYIGNDLVITGRIDRRTINIGARQHTISIVGRGLTRNLVDCSADLLRDPGLSSGTMNFASVFDLATRLARSYGVYVVPPPPGELLKAIEIPAMTLNLGETPYEIVESAARYAGYLVYENEYGNLVLSRVGTEKMASGFTMGQNIEDFHVEFSVDQRYSDYVVVWTTVDQLSHELGLSNIRALPKHGSDETLGEYRLKVIVSEQNTPAYEFGQVRADWEMARRIGRSQAISLTCDSWRDSADKLWTPNCLAYVTAPQADIGGVKWIIGTVTLRKDMSGTHADLVLMPPDAFLPEPKPLTLYDAQLTLSPTIAQAPAPPSTDPPSTPGVP